MTRSKFMVLIALVAFSAVSATGCGIFDLINAANKLQAGQIGSLTGNEIRVLSESAVAVLNQQNGTNLTPMTQAQADALAAFLAANNVQTQQDLQNLQTTAQNNPGAIMGFAELAAAFGNSNPNVDPTQLQQILQQSLGGGA